MRDPLFQAFVAGLLAVLLTIIAALYQLLERRYRFLQRINIRLVAFLIVVTALVVYPVYIMVEAQVTGGIRDAGDGYLRVDLKAMSNFPFDQRNGRMEDIPERWRNLDGKKVIFHGEMWQPTHAGAFVDTFELCYSIAKCCYSGPPQIQHFVHARALPGAQVRLYGGQVRVRGTLHVNVQRIDDRVVSVFQMDVESVTPVR